MNDSKSVSIGCAVSQLWRIACEATFEDILQRNPRQLAQLMASGSLCPDDLTFAAEIFGRSHDGHLVRATLLPLLQHPEAAVREGAIYGLTRHLDNGTIIELKRVAVSDRSPAVRTAAEEALAG